LDDDIYDELVYSQEARKKNSHTVDSSHDESDLGCVCGARKVCVDLLLLGLVERDEAVQDIIASSGVVGSPLVVGKVVLHRAHGKLLLEAVNLVEEQNDRRLNEPARVADGVEQSQGLLHTVDRLIFKQKLVVFRNGDQEEDGGHVLETMDPLLTFGTLSTDVEHTVGQVANNKGSLSDTGGLDTRAEHILVAGHVVGLGDTLNRVKVATQVG
jgi:hypothetical protein